MLPDHPHICLFQPEIPQNTGNLGRLAAAAQCRLHLIKPFGFDVHDRHLLRSGLDYWPYLDLEVHACLDDLLQQFQPADIAFFSKKAKKLYTQAPDHVKLLVFGRETTGLPEDLWPRYPEGFYRLPIYHEEVRSLNLANAVSIVVYERLMRRRSPIPTRMSAP